jgi:hypothetical protein
MANAKTSSFVDTETKKAEAEADAKLSEAHSPLTALSYAKIWTG